MRVVINVPDDEYKAIKDSDRPLYYAEHLIKDGTPYQEPTVDKIRAKIEKRITEIPRETMYGGAMIHGMEMVLRMFDECEMESEE